MAKFAAIKNAAGWGSGKFLREVLQTIGENFGLLEPSVRVSAAANYQLQLGDAVVSRTNAGAQTVTIPTNATVAIPIGTSILVEQTSAGALTIAPAATVTVNRLATKTLVSGGQYGVIRLTKIAANVWNASGDLAAV